MKKVVIVSGARSGIGKYNGQWSNISSEELAAAVMVEAVKRANIDPDLIEDVILGNLAARHGNHARVAWLTTGLSILPGGVTIDRQCGSGLQAINYAATSIMAGQGDIYIAGGVEHMTRNPWQLDKASSAFQRLGPEFLTSQTSTEAFGFPNMGITAENVAEHYQLKREMLDQFALDSQKKAAKAIAKGLFDEEIVAIPVKQKKETILVKTDEIPRPDSTLEALAKMKPAFKPDGVVTAGNACPWSDGAAALVMMSEDKAKELGLTPLASLKSFAINGLDPRYMGLGPVYATQKALQRAGLTMNDLGVIELNEAFAAQALGCIRELDMPMGKINPNGGAIALGHPLGATGAILSLKIIKEMIREKHRYGLVTMCIGGGQGIAAIFERE